jgi:predicted amidophosphoribosyltransferase
VAVPPHPLRRRARGFDPAELIASALARRTGLPLRRALRRSATASHQLGASRADRRDPGRLHFAARGPAPRRVLLVDDVHTTGATLSACAEALRAAGAHSVAAITWARTLDERLR